MYKAVDSAVVRFGVFEADLQTLELHKQGVRLKLPRQSFQILQMLLERRGKLVTRDELRQALWPTDTFVDFDHGLNNAVKRIRDALNDSAETPRYIETLPRLGYRFVGSIDGVPATTAPPATAAKPSRWNSKLRWVLAVCAIAGVVATAAALVAYKFWFLPPNRYDRLAVVPFTTYPGAELAPSFSPDGSQIVFWWSGEETHNNQAGLYIKQLGNEKAVRLTDDSSCVVPAWSPDGGSIAFSRSNRQGNGIYLVPSLGGAVRKLTSTRQGCDRFSYLSWSSDGKWLAFPDYDEKVDVSLKGAHIYILNVETLERRMLPHPAPDCITSWMPAFSPDGKSLALVARPRTR